MLPREFRLRSRRDFQRVYRAGRSWAVPLLALHLLPQPSGRRVGFSVSKKVGNAVTRNTVRRRLSEVVRAELPDWKGGVDGILVARAAAAQAPYEQLAAAVRELARRARLIREPDTSPDTPYIMAAGTRDREAGRRTVPPAPAARA